MRPSSMTSDSKRRRPLIPVTLNGERCEETAATVQALVEKLGLVDRRIAVERNGAIVPRSLWADTAIASGDELEIVHAMGGG